MKLWAPLAAGSDHGRMSPRATLGNQRQEHPAGDDDGCHWIGHADAVTALSVPSNAASAVFYSAGYDRRVIRWRLDESLAADSAFYLNGDACTRVDTLAAKSPSVHCLASCGAHMLVAGSPDGVVRLYDCRQPGNHNAIQWSAGAAAVRSLLFIGGDDQPRVCFTIYELMQPQRHVY